MKAHLRRRVTEARDEGFSLAETLVALGIAAVALLSLLGTSVFALRSSVEGRQNQLAGDLLNGAVEDIRSVAYSAVSMTTANVTATSDAAVDKSVTPHLYDPGAGPAEPLYMQATGGSVLLNPYVQQKATPSGPFTIRRYVTVPAGTPTVRGLPAVKRLTVVVTWKHYGKAHERRVGTLITHTRRGLPLPSYTWTYNGPAALAGTPPQPTWVKNPGNPVDYGFVLVNKGARDSWSLTTNPASPAWTWYHDLNQNGLYEVGEPALGSAGSYATGQIDPAAAPFYVVAHREIGLLELGDSSTGFTATSVAQPTFPSKTVATRLTVTSSVVTPPTASPTPSPTSTAAPTATPAPCTPGSSTGLSAGGVRPVATTQNQYTLTDLLMFNGPPAGDTTALAVNPLGTQATLLQDGPCNFSTNLQTNQAGRLLDPGVAAEWQFQPPSAAQDEFRGTAVVSVWVQCPSSTPTITAELHSTVPPSSTLRGSASTTASGCPSAPSQFHRVDISIPISAFSVSSGNTQRLSLRISTTQPVRLLYGTAAAQARLTIGIK